MAKSKITVTVLAGGSGTRFWPAGRASRPKQLLALDGDDPRSLLALTFDRVAPLSDDPVRLIVARNLERILRKEAGEIPFDATLWEPRPRNTAAAVALAAYTAREEAPDAPVLVVPADHHVKPAGAYRKALRAMASRARKGQSIVTLGLRPTRPATGYGYLKLGERVDVGRGAEVRQVERYVEKPSIGRARRYVADGNHLWNGGTFAFRPDTFIETLHETLPEVAEPFDDAFAQFGRRRFARALRDAYDAVPSVSVDYGVMERAPRVDVVVGTFEWDDLGSWDAVGRHRKTDKAGNTSRGAATLVDS